MDIFNISSEIVYRWIPLEPQHWFRQQAITEAYVDIVLCRHKASLGQDELSQRSMHSMIRGELLRKDLLNSCLCHILNTYQMPCSCNRSYKIQFSHQHKTERYNLGSKVRGPDHQIIAQASERYPEQWTFAKRVHM